MTQKNGDPFELKEWNWVPNRNKQRLLTDSYEQSIKNKEGYDTEFNEKWEKYTIARYTTFFRLYTAKRQQHKLSKFYCYCLTEYKLNGKVGLIDEEVAEYREILEGFYNNINNAVNSLYWEIAILCKNDNPCSVNFEQVNKNNPFWKQIEPFANPIKEILDRRHHIVHYWLEYNLFYIVPFMEIEPEIGARWSNVKEKSDKFISEVKSLKLTKIDFIKLIPSGLNGLIENIGETGGNESEQAENDIKNIQEIALRHGFDLTHKLCGKDLHLVKSSIEGIYEILIKAFEKFARDNSLSKQ